MENDANRTNLTIIIILLLVIVGISIFYMFNHFFTQDKSSGNSYDDSETIENDTKVIENNYHYSKYNVGDAVSLIDSSSWHVMKESTASDPYVTLLRDSRISSYIKYSEASRYLNNDYRKILLDNLGTDSSYIKEVRLITFSDIEEILNIYHLSEDTVIEYTDYSFIYHDTTLIDGISEQNNPLLICLNDGINSARICEGVGNEICAVRPVVIIHKSLLK